jgi:hypothetical protein
MEAASQYSARAVSVSSLLVSQRGMVSNRPIDREAAGLWRSHWGQASVEHVTWGPESSLVPFEEE